MVNRRTFIRQFAGMVALSATSQWATAFVHPLDEPAMQNRMASRTTLLAVTNSGPRLVAVGYRGLVVYSDDGGHVWTQASVPVSSDLVAVTFPTEKLGWAVGHGGVVLHSTDGGATWMKQFDGRQAARVAVGTLERRRGESPEIERLLAEERWFAESGATEPFLGLYFDNERVGYVVGTFNRIFRTEDGGNTWAPWMDRTDNRNGMHFNAISGGGGKVYLVGEQGMVWRLDEVSGRFLRVPTGYSGTLFGLLTVSSTTVVAYGMRGSVYRSIDAGATWERIVMPSVAGVTGGVLLPDGAIVLVNQAGGMVISRDDGVTFTPLSPKKPMSYYGITRGSDGQVVLAGAEGMRSETVR